MEAPAGGKPRCWAAARLRRDSMQDEGPPPVLGLVLGAVEIPVPRVHVPKTWNMHGLVLGVERNLLRKLAHFFVACTPHEGTMSTKQDFCPLDLLVRHDNIEAITDGRGRTSSTQAHPAAERNKLDPKLGTPKSFILLCRHLRKGNLGY